MKFLTYIRIMPVTIVQSCWKQNLWDDQGQEYLDLYGGTCGDLYLVITSHFVEAESKIQLDQIAFLFQFVQISDSKRIMASKLAELSCLHEINFSL